MTTFGGLYPTVEEAEPNHKVEGEKGDKEVSLKETIESVRKFVKQLPLEEKEKLKIEEQRLASEALRDAQRSLSP